MWRFLAPRWLAIHALAVVLAAGCLALGWWQLTRAQGGNALSWGYTVEWPVFAAFVVAFWVKLVRDARRGTGPAARQPRPARPARTEDTDGAPVRLGPAPARRLERPAPVPDDADDPELAAYNRYLGWLNANPHRSPSEYPG
jgi:DNA-binding transcriptional regulator of glucitol operon